MTADRRPPIRLSRRHLLGAAGALAIHGLLPRPAVAAQPLRGLNFSFLDLDRGAVAACRTRGRGASIAGRGFLRRYAEAPVRDGVRSALGRMREDGVDAVRHNLWFIGGDKAPADVFRVADAGRAAEHAGRFAEDLRAAGIGTLLLAFSPVGEAAPACRRSDWGDCFRRDGTGPATAFIREVGSAAAGRLDGGLLLDPFNEGVPSEALKPPVRDAMLEFLAAGLQAAATVRPAPKLVASTQGNRADERLGLLDRTLQRSGIRLDLLDIHVYRGRGTGPDDATLGRFRDWAAARGTGLVVGELQADLDLMRRIRRTLTRGDGRDPVGYFPWPLADAETGCHVDMDVPQLLGRMREAARE